MTATSTVIELIDIYKTYRIGDTDIRASNGINLKILDGELLAIIGASGSGKTTLMNILGLLDRPSEGKYLLAGEDVSRINRNEQSRLRNQHIGFIFQQFYLLTRLSAIRNVMLPLTYRQIKKSEMERRAKESLARVGMLKYAAHRPVELSGGQQQRVAIARALVTEPTLILADEPTGALDSKTSQDVMDLLIELNQKDKATVIIVTHNDHIAEQCHRIIKISDGKIVSGG